MQIIPAVDVLDGRVVRLTQGRFQEAEALLRQAIASDPGMAVAFENLARRMQ